jgi:hypothetical protein
VDEDALLAISCAYSSPASSLMSKIATLTPASDSALALARPRPDAPPVTTAARLLVISMDDAP